MSDKNNLEIFDGKSFQDLTKDIYENQQNKKLQLDLLIQEIHGMIQTLDDAVLVAPLILKENQMNLCYFQRMKKKNY